jgi:tetratricopeptide (TPR) repeat protein
VTLRHSRRGSARGLFGLLAALAVAVIGAAALATAAIAGAAPRRMVLVSVDGLPTGNPGEALPALAALAASGVRCEALAPSPEPFPAWIELLSGCAPARTRVWDETAAIPTGGAGTRWPSLAGSLAAAGWHALALPADPLAHAGTPLARGFERYDTASPALAESARVDTALAWLGRPGRRFAWLALSLGVPVEPWRRVDGVRPRDGAVLAARCAIVDAALARLSARLAALDRDGATCVVVAGTGADDGTSTRVPLLFAGAAARGLQTGGVLHLADVAPTLIALAGGHASGFDGVDLAAPRSAAARTARPPRRNVRADTLAVPVAALEVYEGLIEPGRVDSTRLAAWDALCERFPASARLALERALAQSRGGREAVAARTLKAMATAMPEDARLALAYADHLMRYGRTSLAAEVLGTVDPVSPFAALAQWRRAIAHASEEDFPAAEGAARRAAQLATPNDAAAGVPKQLHALAALHDSCELAPREATTRLRYGRALGEFGLFPAAYKQFHAARALAPASAEPDYWLAYYLLREGRPQNAQPTLERALARDSTYAPARHALAEALLEQNKRAEGRAQLERLATRGDLDAREWYNLACLRSVGGATDAALDALRRAITAGYSDWAAIATDADLSPVRSDPRFPTPPAR